MKKIYLLTLVTFFACIFNLTKITAGNTNCTLDYFGSIPFTSATECENGGVVVLFSNSSPNGNDALYQIMQQTTVVAQGTISDPNFDGFAIIDNLPPGDYSIMIAQPGNTNCNFADIFTVDPFVCDLSDNATFSSQDALGSGCGNGGSMSVNMTGSMCDGTNYHWILTDNDVNTADMSGTDDGFGIISIDQLVGGDYTLTVSGNPDVSTSACTFVQTFTIAEPACDMVISNFQVTQPSGPGCEDGSVTFHVEGTSCSPSIGGVQSYNVYGMQGLNMITVDDLGGQDYGVSGLGSGSYVFTADNTGNGTCFDNETTTLTAPCNIQLSVTGTTASSGSNGSVTFNVSSSGCANPVITLFPQSGSSSTYTSINSGSNTISSLAPGGYSMVLSVGNSCSTTTTFTIQSSVTVPSTQLSSASCGRTDLVRTSTIFCNAVIGGTKYEFQFSNGNGVYATKISLNPYLALHNVTPILGWGTTWSVQVRAYVGTAIGAYGNACTIGIICDPATCGVPLTKVRVQDCGKLNYNINGTRNRIVADPISGATLYEFEFKIGTTVVATKIVTNTVLFLNTVTPALSVAQYSVSVRAYQGAVWGNFGTSCIIGVASINRESNGDFDEVNVSENVFDIAAMPNPFNEQISVTINSAIDEVFNIKVYDLTGQLIEEIRTVSNQKLSIGNDYANGIYIINAINSDGNQVNFKAIKNK